MHIARNTEPSQALRQFTTKGKELSSHQAVHPCVSQIRGQNVHSSACLSRFFCIPAQIQPDTSLETAFLLYFSNPPSHPHLPPPATTGPLSGPGRGFLICSALHPSSPSPGLLWIEGKVDLGPFTENLISLKKEFVLK